MKKVLLPQFLDIGGYTLHWHANQMISVDQSYLSRRMGKPTTSMGENKGADQLHSNCEADQRLCFRYTDSTIPLLSKIQNFKLLACFCDCTA